MGTSLQGDGGISSGIDALLRMNELLVDVKNGADKLSHAKIAPKVDDKDIKEINQEIKELRENIEKTPKHTVELFNTDRIQKTIATETREIDKLYDKVKNRELDLTEKQTKEFISHYKVLENYTKKFEVDLVSKYKSIFNDIVGIAKQGGDAIANSFKLSGTNLMSDIVKHSVADRSQVQAMLREAEKDAASTLKYDLEDATRQANNKLFNEQKQLLLEQKEIAKQNALAFVESERQKRLAIIETQQALTNQLKTQLDILKGSVSDKYLDVDYDKFATFQAKAYDLINLMQELGVETREYENALEFISSKIYIPSNITDGLRQGASESKDKVKELEEEISKLKSQLDSRFTSPEFENLQKELEDAKETISDLEADIRYLHDIMDMRVADWRFDEKVEEVHRLQLEVERLNEELSSAKDENELLSIDNQKLKEAKTNVSEIGDEAREVSKDMQMVGDETKTGFNTDQLSQFLSIISRLEEYLKSIATTLGAVDDNSSFTNIISSVEILLSKLDEMYEKIGTGVYNFDMRVGGGYGTAGDKLLSDERSNLREQYKKVVKKYGSESNLFAEIANVLTDNGEPISVDDLLNTYGEHAINKIDSDKSAVNRLSAFFDTLNRYKELLIDNIKETNDVLQQEAEDVQDRKRFSGEVARFRNLTDAENRNKRKAIREQNAELYNDPLFGEYLRQHGVESSNKDIDNIQNFSLKHDYKTTERHTAKERQNILNGIQQRISENEKKIQALQELSEYDKYAKSDIDNQIAEVNAAERDSILKMQEAGKLELSDVIEQLQTIADILRDISQKPLFADSLDAFKVDLSEVAQQIKDIITSMSDIPPIHVVNDKDRHGMDVIRNSLTGREVSQEAYDVLDKLNRGVDVTVDELRTIPDIVEGFEKLDKYTSDFIGQYEKYGMSVSETADLQDQEREALREYIINLRKASGSFSGIDKDGNDLYNGVVGKDKKATIVFGLPASGKSSAVVNPLSEYYKARVIDSDMIKELLPEFANGWGSSLVHKESSKINIDYLKRSLEDEENVIIPIVGSTIDSINKYVDALKAKGYEIQLALNELPNNLSSMRNMLRFFKDGRFLEPGFVKEYGDLPTKVFEQIKNREVFNGGYLRLDNNVPRGARPNVTAYSENNREIAEYLRRDRTNGSNDVDGDSERVRTKEYQKQIKALNELLIKRRELAKANKEDQIKDIDNQISKEYGVILNALEKEEEQAKATADAENELNEVRNESDDSSLTNLHEEVSAIQEKSEAAKNAAHSKEELVQANQELADSAVKTTDKVQEETVAIEEKGMVAKSTADNKNTLSNANSKLADTSLETTENVKAETDAIKEEERAIENLSETKSGIDGDKKNVTGTRWNRRIDAEGNVSDISRSFKTREELGRTVEYTQHGDSITIREQTDYEKAIRQTADALVQQARAEHDLSIEQEKANPNVAVINALNDKIADCTRRITEATTAAAEFDRELEAFHNDPATGSKFEQYADFTTRYQDAAASKLAEEEKRYSDYISKRNSKLQQQVNSDLFTVTFEIDNGRHTESFIQDLQDIQNELMAIQNLPVDLITEQTVERAKELNTALKELNKTGKLPANKLANENAVIKSLGQINDILSKNTKSAFKGTDVYRNLQSLKKQFQDFDTSKPQSELNDLKTRLLKTVSAFNELGNAVKGKNFFETFVERLRGVNAQLIAQYLSWQDLIRYARTAITTIVDLDTALVDLRKTTTMNNTELNSFYKSSNDIAKQLGVTTAEVINQASAWSRLGYSSKEAATEMAKLSSQFASISPGMDTETAQSSLVSIMKAWDIDVANVESEIMDKINILGNNFAESNLDIVEGMQRSSAALSAVGTSYQDAFALFTGGKQNDHYVQKCA